VKKPLFLFATMIVLVVLCTGCVRDDVNVVGVWGRKIEEYLVRLSFDGGETFTLQVGESDRKINGVYELRGDVILLVDDDCGEIEGKYRVRAQEDAAIFGVLNDACDGRVQVIAGEWFRVGNQ
jgi:hypothetical protein